MIIYNVCTKLGEIFLKTINAQPFTHDEAVNVEGAFGILGGGVTNLMLSLRNVVLALGFLFILIGAIKLATGQGDPEKIASGRQTIMWAIVAMVLSVTFWVILKLILGQIFGVQGIEDEIEFNITPPNL